MSHQLTDDDTIFTVSVTVPDPGNLDVAASVQVGSQALANRTAHIYSGATAFTGNKTFSGTVLAYNRLDVNGTGFPNPSAILRVGQAGRLLIDDGNVLADSDDEITLDPSATDNGGSVRYIGTLTANREYWLDSSAAVHPRGSIVMIVHGDDITKDATIGYSADGGATVTDIVVLPANLWGSATLHRAGVGSAPDRWRLLTCAGAAVPQAGA